MKKLMSLFLVLVVLLTAISAVSADDLKVGIILIHDENSGYDQAHIEGALGAFEALGLSTDNLIFKYNVPETEECYDAAVDLAEQGCGLIISDSFNHKDYMAQAATEYPDVQFVSATGDNAWKVGLDNFSNMFPHTYESRYISGVVAGMKLKELMDAGTVTDPHIGYVGAFPYAEVVSGYTGFFLGIRSIVPEAYMDVQYTNSWYDPIAEAEAANALMARGCVIISQHADSTGAPSAIQAAKDEGAVVYSVGYNIDMRSVAPTAALTSAQNVWAALYTPMIEMAVNGEDLPTDYSAGYAQDAVKISDLGAECAEGTAEAVEAAIAGIKDGSLKIFSTANYTVNGETPTHYFALDSDGDYTTDTEEAIVDGVFLESEFMSAPYFGLRIDGITELTNE